VKKRRKKVKEESKSRPKMVSNTDTDKKAEEEVKKTKEKKVKEESKSPRSTAIKTASKPKKTEEVEKKSDEAAENVEVPLSPKAEKKREFYLDIMGLGKNKAERAKTTREKPSAKTEEIEETERKNKGTQKIKTKKSKEPENTDIEDTQTEKKRETVEGVEVDIEFKKEIKKKKDTVEGAEVDIEIKKETKKKKDTVEGAEMDIEIKKENKKHKIESVDSPRKSLSFTLKLSRDHESKAKKTDKKKKTEVIEIEGKKTKKERRR